MKYLRALGLLAITFSTVLSNPLETSSSRSTPSPGHHEGNEQQLAISNGPIIDVLDVRTPPKIKQELKIKQKEQGEPFHPGIAIPIDDDSIVLEETTKKLNFYKIERPATTTNNGLSTWILLSNTPTTRPPTKKTTAKPETANASNETMVVTDKPNKIAKPIFKKRTTTSKPSWTTKLASTLASSTTNSPKLTKVKASILNNAVNKKNASTTTEKKSTTTTAKPVVHTTKIETTSAESNTTSKDSVSLPAEAKETETELPSDDKKKNKKKKNKNRRRKPQNKEDNTKLKEVQPVSTQLYSYLRSEIIPVTVGVSLVGLLVTAGLASYYLQPFGLLTRRNDPIDRKDNEGGYYYQDQYSGGIPEEDAIGKVIAGMPENSLTNDNGYKTSTTKNSYSNNVRYRHVDRRSQIYMNPYGTVEDVKLDDGAGYHGKQFVVGSVSKELIPEPTPAAVPEHGPRNINGNERKFVVGSILDGRFKGGPSPRNLKSGRRRRREVPDDADNEIINDDTLNPGSTTTAATTSSTPSDSLTHLNETTNALADLFANLFRIKIQLGLEIIRNVTRGVSAYISEIETKLNDYESTSKQPLRLRKRRQVLDTKENEIFPEDDATAHHPKITEPFSNEDTANAHNPQNGAATPIAATEEPTTEVSVAETGEPTNNIMHISQKPTTLMDLLKDLFRLKLRVGLELFQKVSRSVSSYVSSVQSRLNDYRYRDDSKPRC
ncbi:uncharacterized protein LOC132705710 [Cylas formicarius]|uniref:uncharacterized protein LOC132705710 n=1 Tax=Cylas formicarius TaxID=197179 RepID=UPI0029585400|nr:uncharacterized protein LOC132705710 [Cylas formicarius]